MQLYIVLTIIIATSVMHYNSVVRSGQSSYDIYEDFSVFLQIQNYPQMIHLQFTIKIMSQQR